MIWIFWWSYRIHWLYSKVIHRMFLAKIQSIYDRKEQTLSLDTSHLALIVDQTVHWAYWLASHHGEIWREQCLSFGAQRHFQTLLWWSNSFLIRKVLNSQLFSSSYNINKDLEKQNYSQVKNRQKLTSTLFPLFLKEPMNSKFTSWTNSKFQFFWHNSVNCSGVLLRGVIFVQFCEKIRSFHSKKRKFQVSGLGLSNHGCKEAISRSDKSFIVVVTI